MIGACHRCGRRDACPQCGSDLHCCRNCRFYARGRHNDCLETQAERQVDKEAGNFCDYFALAEAQRAEKSDDRRAALDALFSGGRRAVGAGAARDTCREQGGDGAAPTRRRPPP